VTAEPTKDPTAYAESDLYPAVLELFQGAAPGRILDVPAGQGAFARELLARGYGDVHCLDILEDFRLDGVAFTPYDARERLPFGDETFDYVFTIEGLEHFDSPFTFVDELCRVLKSGGRLYLTTPNTFSVDARLKYLMSGYFPRFRPLMQEPERLLSIGDITDTHIAPIYFWQLNYFLLKSGVSIQRLSTNALLRKRQWPKRLLEAWIAGLIRRNIRRRGFPDPGITSEAVLFGDCLILEGIKKPRA